MQRPALIVISNPARPVVREHLPLHVATVERRGGQLRGSRVRPACAPARAVDAVAMPGVSLIQFRAVRRIAPAPITGPLLRGHVGHLVESDDIPIADAAHERHQRGRVCNITSFMLHNKCWHFQSDRDPGYARALTEDERLALQRDELARLGCPSTHFMLFNGYLEA